MKLTVLALVLAASAYATPMAYNEAVDGDLPDGDPLTLLTFGLGANTISGTFADNVTLGTVDFDDFAFLIPTGMHISSGSVSMVSTTVVDSSWFLATGGTDLAGGGGFAGLALDLGLVVHGLSGTAPLHALPLGEGIYHVTQTNFQPLNPFLFPVSSADYTFTFNVDLGTVTTLPPGYSSSAPELSTWLMTVLGLSALVWRRGLA